MNETLAKAIKSYSMDAHSGYAGRMHGFSKDTIIGMFSDLLTMYINDKNSSTLREFITVSVAGYEHEGGKIGFNGYKHATVGKPLACEAKPKNVDSNDYEEYRRGERKTFRKLNGGGNFTDYTWARFERDCGENLNMLVSGFVDGKLAYVLEFPFAEESFKKKLRQQLQNHFPNGDESGRFLRSASFDYRDFMDGGRLILVYANDGILRNCEHLFVGGFYKKLAALARAGGRE